MHRQIAKVVVSRSPVMKMKRTTVLRLVVVAVVLIAIITTVVIVRSNKHAATTAKSGPQLTTTELNTKVTDLVQHNKLADAEKLLLSQAATKQTESGYILLASVQTSERKYDAAAKTINEAESKLGVSYTFTLQLADVYVQNGDYKSALTQYKKAQSLIDTHPEQAGEDKAAAKANLQDTINALEKVKQ